MDFLKEDRWKETEPGLYLSSEMVTDTVFSDEQQDGLWKIEDASWWFQYRASVITGLMDEYFHRQKLIIDVGGGNGYTSYIATQKGYRAALMEPSVEACRHARQRGHEVVCCGTVAEDTIRDNSIDQVLLLDVLEHIEDDRQFLTLLNRKVASGGYCVITVPAFMCLWSSEDDAARHFRRYRIKPLCTLLKTCGFDVCYRSYFMGFLFLPILLVRVMFEKVGLLKKQDERSDEEREKITESQFKVKSDIVNVALGCFEGIERRLMKKQGRVPFGSSIVIVVRKE